MADLGLVYGEIKNLPPELRPVFKRIFTAIMKDIRLGHPQGQQPDPMVNLGGGFFHGTTASVANQEFTIPHGFGRTPYLAFPVLRLDAVNSTIVPLTVTRVADDKRLYLSSSVTGAAISLAVEG